MTKRVTDLTAEELELLAGEAWSNAAREALAKGLSVTGSRDGRRYRYHPDGRIDDLGPVAAASVTLIEANVESPTRESVRFGTPSFEMPKFDMPKVEMPAADREIAERGVAQAQDTYEKMKAAAERATDFLTSIMGAFDYGLKKIEAARVNENSAFDFAGELIAAKALWDVVEFSSAHARKQFEALTVQLKEFTALVQKVAAETSEPFKTTAHGKAFADELMMIKSLSEGVEMSMTNARKRFEALTAQSKALARSRTG